MSDRISVIVCAFNEERYVGPCLEALGRQTRRPDELIVVNNASTDGTRRVAERHVGVVVVDEPIKGLVRARARGHASSTGDILVYTDADCRPPATWLARLERELLAHPDCVAVTGTYRFYDWDVVGRVAARIYDFTLARFAHVVAQDVLKVGAVLYGANFAVRRRALDAIGGFDTSIEFHGEDTNLGRRLAGVGRVLLLDRCFTATSARRYRAMGRFRVFRLYVRNFWWETVHHRPRDRTHEDVRL
jgi:glycosyltransferase involved in cell wall biosynthesis